MEKTHPGLKIERPGVDDTLIEKAAAGDRSALAAIYDGYARQVYRYHYSRVGNAQDAEDLTAQTFMAVLESLPRYQRRAPFSAWLIRIARNKAADFFRGQGHNPAEVPPEAVHHDVVLEEVINSQEHEKLRRLLGALTEEERELIRLRYTAQLTFAEIGGLLGRKEDAVRKSLTRLLERLYHQMEVWNA